MVLMVANGSGSYTGRGNDSGDCSCNDRSIGSSRSCNITNKRSNMCSNFTNIGIYHDIVICFRSASTNGRMEIRTVDDENCTDV